MNSHARNYAISLFAGLLLGLAFPAWHWWPVAWVALAPLFYRASAESARHSAAHFFVAGLAFHAIVLQWLLANVYWAGGWAIWGYALLCVYMALYWALLGALLAWVLPRMPAILAPVSAGVLWAAMEFAQARLFTGFGWSALGYSQGPNLPLLQWASLGGVFIIGFLVATVNAALALVVAEPRGRWLNAMGAVILLAAVHGVGFLLIQPAQYGETPFRVGIVQSDFPLEMKWDDEYTVEMVRNAASKSAALAAHEPVDLFVWPESLVMTPVRTPEVFRELTTLTRTTGTPLYTGTVRVQGAANYNSSNLIMPDGSVAGEYDKVHLAPFGEYVPLSSVWPFIGKIIPAIGDVAAGDDPQVFEVGGKRFGPLICFEVLFPKMAEHLRRENAEMLVVITNLGWFGSSNAIPEELEFARLRAVETRLPLVHAANTGISGVFDPWGRFTPIAGWVDDNGQFRRAAGEIAPSATIMQRLVDGFDVAEPGNRPIPYGPAVTPWMLVVASVVMVVIAAMRRPKTATPLHLRSSL